MHAFRLMLLALAITAGCSKSDSGNDGPPDPAPATGTPTPVGAPDGTPAASAVIGAAGGTLSSADGQLKITIPAGAFTADQTVSIERIASQNPLGVGRGYRLKPEGVRFTKPVSLTFQYFRADSIAYPPEAMRIAYQDAKGVWMAKPATVNTDNRTATVLTDHFSDWTLFTPVRLEVDHPVVNPGGSTVIRLILADEFLAPLTKEQPIKANLPADSRFIKSWKVTGPGALTGTGAINRYVAPPKVTAGQNKATISVEVYRALGKPETVKLNAEIRTMEGFLKISIDGGDEITLPANPVGKVGDFYQLSTTYSPQATALVISWPFGVGSHGFSIEPRADKAVISLFHNDANYGQTWLAGDVLRASPGAVTITSMGAIDGLVTGKFVVEKGGKYPLLKSTVHYEGTFQTTIIGE
ncbi:hypothetical protein [Chitinophaga sp.]|uniref:hypothetical protein n=1 Tax=Chitinophaga sp. TaxID=1869181 RepID=UPI0026218D61|nr:hypothetical protein [uncultured Chitinophaga sp.]